MGAGGRFLRSQRRRSARRRPGRRRPTNLGLRIAIAPGAQGGRTLQVGVICQASDAPQAEAFPKSDWSHPMDEPTRRIKGLGEVALRVADLDAMQRFYQEVVGL